MSNEPPTAQLPTNNEPSSADRDANGVPDSIDALPALVPVLDGSGGTVGFIDKKYVWQAPGEVFPAFPLGPPVVDANGVLVGYAVPDRGFVPKAIAEAPGFLP